MSCDKRRVSIEQLHAQAHKAVAAGLNVAYVCNDPEKARDIPPGICMDHPAFVATIRRGRQLDCVLLEARHQLPIIGNATATVWAIHATEGRPKAAILWTDRRNV